MREVEEAIARYLQKGSGHSCIRLKAVLFDMDGVLYDSMPLHAQAWKMVMDRHHLPMSREEVFLNEGRTGAGTIDMIHMRTFGTHASKDLQETIYHEKCEEFQRHPEPGRMPGALELLEKVRQQGLTPVLVTGSGQASLVGRLERDFPGCFARHLMVTANDVAHGKPDPEPYLKGLEKAGVRPDEAIVIENAPIGVRSAVAAGIFTVAANTGPLNDSVLLSEGASMVYPGMEALRDDWEHLFRTISSVSCQ